MTAKFNDHGARLAAGYNTRASGKAVAKVLFVAVEGGGGCWTHSCMQGSSQVVDAWGSGRVVDACIIVARWLMHGALLCSGAGRATSQLPEAGLPANYQGRLLANYHS